MIKYIRQLDIFKNFYYILGIMLQKGFPYLIIPLISWKFGTSAYSDYIVIYSLVQITSLIISVGTPSSFIIFWHEAKDKSLYFSTILLIVSIISLLLFIPVAFIIKHFVFNHLTFLVLIYAFIFNLNTLSLNLLRAEMRSKAYFLSVLATSLVQLLLIIFSPHNLNGFLILTFINMGALFIQALLFYKKSSVQFYLNQDIQYFKALTQKVLNYSFPLMFYALLSLSNTTIDKWIVKAFFARDALNEYVLNFQCAFIVNVISVVIGMYSLPIFCQLIAEQNFALFKKKLYQNYALTILVSFVISIAEYCYAKLTFIPLTAGFWWLVAAFCFTNLFTLNVSVFESFKKIRLLLVTTIIPNIFFWLVFLFGTHKNSISIIYVNYIVYYFILFIASYFIVINLLNHKRGHGLAKE